MGTVSGHQYPERRRAIGKGPFKGFPCNLHLPGGRFPPGPAQHPVTALPMYAPRPGGGAVALPARSKG